jgi:tubulin polyglutamylase TTLL1
MSSSALSQNSNSSAGSSASSAAAAASSASSSRRIKFKTDFEKGVILTNFEKRGWVRSQDPQSLLATQLQSAAAAQGQNQGISSGQSGSNGTTGGPLLIESDWNFYWANVGNVKAIFNPENGYRLHDHQILNHFPNHYELTRKDLMVKNIRRYKKDLDKQEMLLENSSGGGGSGFGGNNTMAAASAAAAAAAAAREQRKTIAEFVPITYSLPSDYGLFVEEYKKNPQALWIMKPSNRAQGKGIFLVSKLSQIKKWAKDRWASNGGANKE